MGYPPFEDFADDGTTPIGYDIGIAMGLKNTALKSAIDEALAQMEADGFIKETYDYWFGSAQ